MLCVQHLYFFLFFVFVVFFTVVFFTVVVFWQRDQTFLIVFVICKIRICNFVLERIWELLTGSFFNLNFIFLFEIAENVGFEEFEFLLIQNYFDLFLKFKV